ncbi:MAG: di-trans,poly-cis-decaprenylcistransferase [Malacoplasma sp.]|nr:di-trans,poly-cis-decaprenylcistransferase [Malacoplasma sp.]
MTKKLNHIAFIMDGNGRWAKQQNKPRVFGHAEGVKNILPIIEYCIKKEISQVSFFAFSIENWNRSKSEVNFLMKLFSKYLTKKTILKMEELGIVGKWIGFENNLDNKMIQKIKKIEEISNNFLNKKIQAIIFFNYSGIQEIINAIEKALIENPNNKINPINFLLTSQLLPIDLLVRTSGEQRISNFCLYNLAYSEIIFEKTYWPDYDIKILEKNINEYYLRDRRFGKAK